jgi:hypothetical protein
VLNPISFLGETVDFRRKISKLLKKFRKNWRDHVWVGIQFAAMLTILLSPVWTEQLAGPRAEFRNPRRDVASMGSGKDAGITSAVLPFPAMDSKEERIFVNARQVRFEWRSSLDQREPARSKVQVGEWSPFSLEKRDEDTRGFVESISLIPSEGGGIVVSTFVELKEGVNFFRAQYRAPEGKIASRDFLVILKK